MQEQEIWKDIEGYEGLYRVSNLGRVMSLIPQGRQKCRILKPCKNKQRQLIALYKDKKAKFFLIHRLVAMAFVEGYKPGLVVNHKDENQSNNRWDNLEWITSADNLRYGTARSRGAEKQSHPIEQLTKDGQHVAQYPSISEAARQIGLSYNPIYYAVNGKARTAGGFYWRKVTKDTPVAINIPKPKLVPSLPGEEWRDVKGYEGLYQVSNLGQVKALHYHNSQDEQLLPIVDWPRGYKKVRLCKDGGRKMKFVHRIVAEAFIGDITGMEINHKDGNPSNNRADNLEIVTHQQNIDHSWQHLGRQIWSKGVRGAVAARARPVMAIDENGVIVHSTDTLRQMADVLGISLSPLLNILKGRTKHLQKYPNLRFQYGERKKYRKS